MAGLASTALRNAECTWMAGEVDTGASPGNIVFFTTSAATVETARCQLAATAFAAPSGGVMAFATGTEDGNADGGAGATTTYFQVQDGNGRACFHGTVSGDTGGTGDIQFPTGTATVTINAGDIVNLNWASTTYTAPSDSVS